MIYWLYWLYWWFPSLQASTGSLIWFESFSGGLANQIEFRSLSKKKSVETYGNMILWSKHSNFFTMNLQDASREGLFYVELCNIHHKHTFSFVTFLVLSPGSGRVVLWWFWVRVWSVIESPSEPRSVWQPTTNRRIFAFTAVTRLSWATILPMLGIQRRPFF